MASPKTLSDIAETVRQRGRVGELTPRQLQEEARRQPPLLIDVREPEERQRGLIEGSVGIPRGVLERDIAKTCFPGPRGKGEVSEEHLNTPVVLYCGGGSRSLLAGEQLAEMGFTNVRSLAGGFSGWQKSGGAVSV